MTTEPQPAPAALRAYRVRVEGPRGAILGRLESDLLVRAESPEQALDLSFAEWPLDEVGVEGRHEYDWAVSRLKASAETGPCLLDWQDVLISKHWGS